MKTLLLPVFGLLGYVAYWWRQRNRFCAHCGYRGCRRHNVGLAIGNADGDRTVARIRKAGL